MSIRTYLTHWTDEDGRKWFTSLPLGVPESEAYNGLPVGPPPLDDLGLPKELEVQLHNALAERGILTAIDAQKRPMEILSAVQAVFKATVHEIQKLYV